MCTKVKVWSFRFNVYPGKVCYQDICPSKTRSFIDLPDHTALPLVIKGDIYS